MNEDGMPQILKRGREQQQQQLPEVLNKLPISLKDHSPQHVQVIIKELSKFSPTFPNSGNALALKKDSSPNVWSIDREIVAPGKGGPGKFSIQDAKRVVFRGSPLFGHLRFDEDRLIIEDGNTGLFAKSFSTFHTFCMRVVFKNKTIGTQWSPFTPSSLLDLVFELPDGKEVFVHLPDFREGKISLKRTRSTEWSPLWGSGFPSRTRSDGSPEGYLASCGSTEESESSSEKENEGNSSSSSVEILDRTPKRQRNHPQRENHVEHSQAQKERFSLSESLKGVLLSFFSSVLCVMCGKKSLLDCSHFAHYVAHSLGGAACLANFSVICSDCNKGTENQLDKFCGKDPGKYASHIFHLVKVSYICRKMQNKETKYTPEMFKAYWVDTQDLIDHFKEFMMDRSLPGGQVPCGGVQNMETYKIFYDALLFGIQKKKTKYDARLTHIQNQREQKQLELLQFNEKLDMEKKEIDDKHNLILRGKQIVF